MVVRPSLRVLQKQNPSVWSLLGEGNLSSGFVALLEEVDFIQGFFLSWHPCVQVSDTLTWEMIMAVIVRVDSLACLR